jgi:hypothetical protein
LIAQVSVHLLARLPIVAFRRFANNTNAQSFYQNLGFQPEMITMVKAL